MVTRRGFLALLSALPFLKRAPAPQHSVVLTPALTKRLDPAFYTDGNSWRLDPAFTNLPGGWPITVNGRLLDWSDPRDLIADALREDA